MKNQRIKFILANLLLTTGIAMATNPLVALGDKPVDEGQKNVHKEDRIKGSTLISNKFKSETMSLAKENGKIFKITLKKASHTPITCKVIRDNHEIINVQGTTRTIVFDIDTSLLKVDDNITITNRYKAIGEILVKE
ncbi:MAG: hypothetical protein K0U38_11135 [Epsilonproteobacteria bacterium]|nr:hypothetical protein [Campylobacterota bacterium]